MNDKSKIYVQSSLYGVIRSVIGLPFEHPFDSIKTKLQADYGNNKKFLNATIEIYRRQGVIEGFYSGFVPNAFRSAIKQVYRWPMILYFPQMFKDLYPEWIRNEYPSIHKTSAGFMIAIMESLIICPLERLKVSLMTRKNQLSIAKFMHESKGNLKKSLFQGLESQLCRQVVSWVSFLYFEFKCKDIARKIQNIPDGQPLGDVALVSAAVCVGILNLICVMPFDLTKTLYQQHQAVEYKDRKLTETMKLIYKKRGFSAFYVGWQPRMVQYVIQSVFTVTALDRLERMLSKPSSS